MTSPPPTAAAMRIGAVPRHDSHWLPTGERSGPYADGRGRGAEPDLTRSAWLMSAVVSGRAGWRCSGRRAAARIAPTATSISSTSSNPTPSSGGRSRISPPNSSGSSADPSTLSRSEHSTLRYTTAVLERRHARSMRREHAAHQGDDRRGRAGHHARRAVPAARQARDDRVRRDALLWNFTVLGEAAGQSVRRHQYNGTPKVP